MKQPAVYILASKCNGALYTGVMSNLARRVWEHRNGEVDGFTKKYVINLLVWFELHAAMPDAIWRGKQPKKWRRTWKLALISRGNPEWRDLYPEVLGSGEAGGFPLSRE